MTKIYSSFFLFFSLFYISQQLDVQINEINYYGDSSPKRTFKLNNKLIFEASDYRNQKNLYSFDYLTKKKSVLIENFTNSYKLEDHFQIKVNGELYFLNAGTGIWQLWKTDGTETGTTKLVDFDSSINQITEFIYHQGKFYFISNNDLLVSDGTQTGTLKLKTFNNVLTGGIGLNGLIPFKNRVYFGASDEPVNKEVWSTDGTVAGTEKLLEINPTYSSLDSKFKGIATTDYLYFGASSAQNNSGLWKTDGTATGTNMVKKFDYFYSLEGVNYNEKIIFSGYDAATGYEIWISDGSSAGTYMIKDTEPGTASGFAASDSYIYNFNGQVYFTSRKSNAQSQWRMEIWKTNGTAEGTTHVKDIDNVLIQKSFISSEGNHLIFNNTITSSEFRYFIFNKNEDLTPVAESVFTGNYSYVDLNENELIFPLYDYKNYGTELFIFNQSANTFQNLVDINSTSSANPSTFYVSPQGDLIFQAEDKLHGNEFYRMNKNSLKPELITDLNPNSSSMNKGELLKIGNYLYLKNKNGSTYNHITRTDGTAQNSAILGAQDAINVNDKDLFENLNDQSLIFTSNSYLSTSKLYKLDNNSTQLKYISDVKLGFPKFAENYLRSVAYNNEVYFLAEENGKNVIYKTDGSSINTTKVISFNNTDNSDGNPLLLGVFNGKLLLSKNKKEFEANSEMWSYDASTGNLVKEKEFAHLDDFSQNVDENILNLKVISNTLYVFTRYSNFNNIYISDATSTNNFTLTDKGYYYLDILNCGANNFLLTGHNADNIYEIFKTDKTLEGTTTSVSQNYNGIKDAKCINNYLYYLNGETNKIWRSNGNATENVGLNLNVTNGSQLTDEFGISKLISDGEKLYFVAKTNTSGVELYSVITELPVYLNVSQTQSNNKIKLILYPNPASSFIKIKENTSSEVETYKVFDMTGKQILSGKYKEENQSINISKLTSGNYIIEITTKNGNRFSQKFIKK